MTSPGVTRVAMWSGPRNLSTALMYAFGNRADCFAWDEPFYAFSLRNAGNDHPLRELVLASYEDDYERVVAACLAPPPAGKTVFYQKQMTHHMLPGYDLAWIKGVENAFLIRRPERVLASSVKKWTEVSLRDIGFVQQAEIFAQAADHLGFAPPVLDADDLLAQPEAMLRALCGALGLGFDPAMLTWPAGPKPFDGVWAAHWYDAVWRSTGFAQAGPVSDTSTDLPDALRRLADEARPSYERLSSHRLRPVPAL